MRATRRFFLALGLVSVLGGCSQAYMLPDVDLTQADLPESAAIPEDAFFVKKPHPDVKSVQFVVLLANSSEDPVGYENLIRESLTRIGFARVLSRNEYTKFLISSGLYKDVSSTFDPISLYRVAESVGPFLVMTFDLHHGGNAVWHNRVQIYDPTMSELLLKFEYDRLNWMSLNYEFVYPAVNEVRDWYTLPVSGSAEGGLVEPESL